jgi:hypothetical protein
VLRMPLVLQNRKRRADLRSGCSSFHLCFQSFMGQSQSSQPFSILIESPLRAFMLCHRLSSIGFSE